MRWPKTTMVIDGVTFAAIEAQGVATFLEQIQDELVQRTYVPLTPN